MFKCKTAEVMRFATIGNENWEDKAGRGQHLDQSTVERPIFRNIECVLKERKMSYSIYFIFLFV